MALLAAVFLKSAAPFIKDGRISWPDYEERYLAETAQQGEDVRRLAQMASCGVITLLCFEPEEKPHCHRHLLKALLEERMRSVPERRPRSPPAGAKPV